jgi:microcystin-dependent protein
MGTPYLSEIRVMSFNFPPKGWAACNGQLLPINQNQPLFSLLGTTYGGDGRTNFALPNLQGRAPMHFGQGYSLGTAAGAEAHTLTASEMPAHLHVLNASKADATSVIPTGAVLADTPGQIYADPKNFTTLLPESIDPVGGSQPHTNMQPYLVLNFCIALVGEFPSPN